jgi:PEP-CTERM motif
MPRLKCVISAVLFCTAIVFFATSANADATYTYRGNPFAVIQCILPLTNCVGSSIDGSFTLASRLGDNLNNAFVNPRSYSFAGDGVIDSSLNVAPGNPPIFEFSTDAWGQIDGWSVLLAGVQRGSPLGELDVEFESFSNPSGILCPCFPSGSEDGVFESIGGLSYNLGPPGTWTVSGVPEPASRTLLIAGLAGLAGLALKKAL